MLNRHARRKEAALVRRMPFERLRRRYSATFLVPLSEVRRFEDIDPVLTAEGVEGVFAPGVGVIWLFEPGPWERRERSKS